MAQAILLDCRNFDKDAKKGTARDVAALKHLKTSLDVPPKKEGPWYKELMEARKDPWLLEVKMLEKFENIRTNVGIAMS